MTSALTDPKPLEVTYETQTQGNPTEPFPYINSNVNQPSHGQERHKGRRISYIFFKPMQYPIITLPEDIRNAHGIREEDNEKESGLIIEKR